METLHRLAGVRDPSELATDDRPNHPVPDTDARSQYAGSEYSISRLSRASIPLHTKSSHLSVRSGKGKKRIEPSTGLVNNYNAGVGDGAASLRADEKEMSNLASPKTSHDDTALNEAQNHPENGQTDGIVEEDFEWGPSHPCFPLPNPYCPPESDEYKRTRVIRVRRDWLTSGDLYPQYANLYPETLDPLITDEEFRFAVSNLNSRLKDIFNPFQARSLFDTIAGILTGFLWDDFALPGPKAKIKSLENWVNKWNRDKQQAGKEVRMVQLRTTGFMSLDFVIPDPEADPDADDAGTETELQSPG